MQTETLSTRFRGIEAWDDREILEALVESSLASVAAVRAAVPALRAAAEAIVGRLRADGRLALAGAGTSARLAVQDGVELMPTFGWPREKLCFLIAGGTDALMRAIEGAEDDTDAAEAAVAAENIGEADALIGISASGRTPYAIAAVRAAKRRGALTIGIANNPDAPLLAAAELPVLLDTGAEPIAGSTRMKAGTAQKVALNLLSTLVMIRLGRVYDGRMVDVVATSDKLRQRSLDMVKVIAGIDEAAARQALEAAGGHVKLAVLVAKGMSADAGRALLDANDGDLRAALVAHPS